MAGELVEGRLSLLVVEEVAGHSSGTDPNFHRDFCTVAGQADSHTAELLCPGWRIVAGGLAKGRCSISVEELQGLSFYSSPRSNCCKNSPIFKCHRKNSRPPCRALSSSEWGDSLDL